jgi:hypothetical protein
LAEVAGQEGPSFEDRSEWHCMGLVLISVRHREYFDNLCETKKYRHWPRERIAA